MKEYLLSVSYMWPKSDLVAKLILLYLNNKIQSKKIMERQEELFSRWKEKYDYFEPDGIVDPMWYNSSWLKLTFILKEVNAKEDEEFDLTEFLREGVVGSTWNNISRWSAGLLFERKYEDVEYLNGEDRKKYLSPISVINLKKTPGGASSDGKEIEDFASEDRDFIKKQLEIYSPDVIVCCGTGTTFITKILGLEGSNWIKQSDDFWYLWHEDTLVVGAWHPQQRTKGRTNRYLFENLVTPLKKIIADKIELIGNKRREEFEKLEKKVDRI